MDRHRCQTWAAFEDASKCSTLGETAKAKALKQQLETHPLRFSFLRAGADKSDEVAEALTCRKKPAAELADNRRQSAVGNATFVLRPGDVRRRHETKASRLSCS